MIWSVENFDSSRIYIQLRSTVIFGGLFSLIYQSLIETWTTAESIEEKKNIFTASR